MSKNSIEITLIVSQKTGVLPLLMLKLDTLGLIYRRCITKEYKDDARLTLVCMGDLDCDKGFLIKSLREVPNVKSIISIINCKVDEIKPIKTLSQSSTSSTELSPLRAKGEITHDVINIVEARLDESFGPTVNLLLKSALKKSKCVGDLFLILVEELAEDQKVGFLRGIEDLE